MSEATQTPEQIRAQRIKELEKLIKATDATAINAKIAEEKAKIAKAEAAIAELNGKLVELDKALGINQPEPVKPAKTGGRKPGSKSKKMTPAEKEEAVLYVLAESKKPLSRVDLMEKLKWSAPNLASFLPTIKDKLEITKAGRTEFYAKK